MKKKKSAIIKIKSWNEIFREEDDELSFVKFLNEALRRKENMRKL